MGNRHYKIFRKEYRDGKLVPVTNYFESMIEAICYRDNTIKEYVAEAEKAWNNGEYSKFHELRSRNVGCLLGY